jgi:ATP-dependent Clp protease adaptor protein ClpS
MFSPVLSAITSMPAPAVKPAQPRVQPPVKPEPSPPVPEPLWHVILLNDDEHTYEYVIEMLSAIFGYGIEKGFKLAKEVDEHDRVIVATCHKELAELRQEQIHEFGPDPRLPKCKGSMRAEIEPAA